jgi:hypothetical protein
MGNKASCLRNNSHGSQTLSEKENDMSTSLALFLGLFWIGLGIFFMGVGVLWWVSILAKEKKEEYRKLAA